MGLRDGHSTNRITPRGCGVTLHGFTLQGDKKKTANPGFEAWAKPAVRWP